MNGRFLTVAAILATSPFVTGCASTSKTAQGAGIGGAIGAGTGALIGKATNGKAGQGALVGGLIGAGVGGLIGNEHDQRDKAAMEARVQQAEAQAHAEATQMGIADVIQWAKEGRSDDLIINQIRTTGSTYQLSSEDVRLLSSNGVSERVVIEMQNRRPELYPRRRLVPVAPVPVIYGPPPPVYVMPVPPPPPPGFGVGVHFRN
jgi:Glycine zipper